MITRKATKSDIKTLSKLFDDYRIFYKKQSDVQSAENFLFERIQNQDSEIFVTENDSNEIIGFVQLYPIFSSTRMQRLWLLNDLFVSQNYRGKGVSVQLIDEAKKVCMGTNGCGLVLETSKTNHIGNNLYPKTGFTLDTENNYYSWDNK
ncbi:GNAT family N-acetyltransferase [Avrilella dinanensis]|uniref:GNAT family N-acetyltransferase n=1 Tax=Avrilella dinanensis TaxID=2008672 RepID=A0A2M9R5F3_9FLAO|nr:GNAT family N-acetyltransferase [Avrilella dinanensis]PJR04097.1 GNAT family N-acetyltransferase [Avrilella dinanensis]